MHSLIICGTPWCDLQAIGQHLHASGMAAPKPAPGRVVETLADWHQSLFEQQHTDISRTRKAVTPGKAWELAASELFLANWQQPVWGWADARNTWLLNFWHDFDPHIRFVLVHTPATQALARAVAQADAGPFSAHEVLDLWCAYQTELLAFYLRHRDRCVWIQAAQIDTPASWLPALSQQWRLELEPGRAHATAQTATTDPELTQLLASLARQAVAQHGQAQGVQDEVLATLPPLPALPHAPQLEAAPATSSTGFDALQASDLLHALTGQLGKDLKQQIVQLQQQNQEALQHNAQLAAELDQTQAQRDAQAALARDRLAALDAEAHAKAEIQAQFSQLQARHQDATQESELLLLQLHQVQEELEHYFLQHQQAQKDLQHTRERLAKWAQRYPNHCEWDTLHVPVATDEQLQLQLRGVQHGSRMLDVLEIHLDAAQNTLQLNRTGSGNAPLLRWPDSLADGQPLALTLVFDTSKHPATILDSPALNQLTPSDLQMLQAICLNVAQALPADISSHDRWVKLCQQWAQAFHSLPVCWRFDSIGLHHEQVNPDYEHLWFNLANVHFGARHWPRFEFRLSASNVRKKSFTHLPKLEFPLPPDNASKQFENWFEESEDDKGPKFELRFDTKTPAMDVSCWRALNAVDQAQCLSLLQHLPYMLDLLQAGGASIHRPWTDWQEQVVGIQRALVTCLNLPSDPFAPAANAHA